jgi:hypothetical protein
MRRVHPGLGGVTLAGIILLGIEGLALHSGSGLALAGAIGVALIAILIFIRVSLVTAGIGSVMIATFTMPWNGVIFGGVRPGDVFVLIALVCFVAADVHGKVPRMPWWVNQLTLAIILVAALHILVPTDPAYLVNRIVVGANGVPTITFQTNLGVAFKFVVAIGAIPVAFCYCVYYEERSIRWVPVAYILGTAVSSVIAFVDGLGITDLGEQITGNHYQLAREGGLSNHPNYLAASCILAIPMGLWMATQEDRRTRILGIFATAGVAAGDYATGSRGGAVCLVLGAGAAFLLLPWYRRRLFNVALAVGALAAVVFAVVPGAGAAILKATRLSGAAAADTSGSNAVRAIVGHQGIQDFKHSPLDGIGLQVADQAQNVYLQELASGGILLFAALLIYTLSNLRLSISLMRYYDLAGALVACAIASTVFNYLEADLTDRFFYVPTAIAVMLAQHFRSTHDLSFDEAIPSSDETSSMGARIRRNLDAALRLRRAPAESVR